MPGHLLALAALSVSAAAAGVESPCLHTGGSPWRELRTAHFVLATDLAAAAADELRAIPRHPVWLGEGLATFVEGAGEGTAGETLRLGAATLARVRAARKDRAPVSEVLIATRGSFKGPQYATSWLLVHFLRTKHGDRLVAYERRLARGEDPGTAWVAVFPEWNPAEPAAIGALDRALTRYVRDDGEYVEERWTGQGEGAFRVSELTPADVGTLCRALPRPRF